MAIARAIDDSGGYDAAIEREIAKYLGLPVCYSEHELPQFSHSGVI